ncbi:hypothetical protein ACJX0J_007820, partial [Zea mays]
VCFVIYCYFCALLVLSEALKKEDEIIDNTGPIGHSLAQQHCIQIYFMYQTNKYPFISCCITREASEWLALAPVGGKNYKADHNIMLPMVLWFGHGPKYFLVVITYNICFLVIVTISCDFDVCCTIVILCSMCYKTIFPFRKVKATRPPRSYNVSKSHKNMLMAKSGRG